MNKDDVKQALMPFIVFILASSVLALGLINYIDIVDYTEVNVLEVYDSTIIIGRDCEAIIATTSPERAESIQLGLDNTILERPNTHDTIATILNSFNITLDGVYIEGMREDYYHSDMLLRDKDKILRLDSKPSDAIAIALRTNSTIYIKRSLLAEHGENICNIFPY